MPSVAFNNGERETALICLSGAATVKVAEKPLDVAQYDSIYIPRGGHVQVTTTSNVDFAEFSADVENAYPLQVVRFADICKDPSLKFTTGMPGQQRHLNICVGKNVDAGTPADRLHIF
jgi:5-deoxy-glucuronate isomerase